MAHPFAARLRRRPPVLYAILDAGLVGDADLVAEGCRLIEAGVDALQVRAKNWPAGRLLQAVESLAPRARAASIPLVVNDRVDVAKLAAADGAHVGPTDLPPEEARALLGPFALLGFSTHSLAEVLAAPSVVDYLGFGAIFATRTRENSSVAGVAALTQAVAESTLPLLAIGGLHPDNLRRLRGSGVAGVAVASALASTGARPGAVEAMRRALDRW
jgi:thiamine-phosphate pyrophosphorylase